MDDWGAEKKEFVNCAEFSIKIVTKNDKFCQWQKNTKIRVQMMRMATKCTKKKKKNKIFWLIFLCFKKSSQLYVADFVQTLQSGAFRKRTQCFPKGRIQEYLGKPNKKAILPDCRIPAFGKNCFWRGKSRSVAVLTVLSAKRRCIRPARETGFPRLRSR